MSLDDTLQSTLDTLRRSLGDALSRELGAAGQQLRTAIDQERRTILEQAEQTARAAADLRAAAAASAAPAVDLDAVRQAAYDEGFDAGRTDGWESGRTLGHGEGRQAAMADAAARDAATGDRLVAAIRQIDTMTTVPDMLDTLLRCATREASRAAVLIVRGSELQGWRFVGFGARTDNPTEFRQAIVGSGVIEEAIRTGVAASTHGAVRVPAPAFAELKLGRRAIGVPIIIQGRPVAVLYADQGSSAQSPEHPSEGASWPAAVEVMTRHASRCLEANGALRQAAPAAAPAAPSAQPALLPVGSGAGARGTMPSLAAGRGIR